MSSPSLDLDAALMGFVKDRDWPFKILMGGFIYSAAVALFRVNPGFVPVSIAMWGLANGYLLRVMRQSIKGELDLLPDWSDGIDLLVSGLSWLSICLGFGFFTLTLLVTSLIVADNSKLLNMTNANFLPWAVGTFLVTYILAFLFNFFLSILMANFAEDEKMMAGFAWRKVMSHIARKPLLFLTTWLASLAICFYAVFLPMLTVVGVLTVPFFAFLAEVMAVRIIGQAWLQSKPPAAEEQTA